LNCPTQIFELTSLPKCIDYTGVKGSHSANKKTKFWIQQRSNEATEGTSVWRHRTVRCAPDCPVCTGQCPVRPEDTNLNSSLSGFLGSRRAIIHRTVRCAPDMSGAPRKRGLRNSPASGSRGSRSAKIHRTVRCAPDCPVCQRSNGSFRRQRLPAVHLMRAQRAQRQTCPYRCTGHQTVHVRCAPDTQEGPQVRSSNGQNPTAVMTWQGHRTVRCAPDCPVRHRADASSQRSSLVVGAINTPTTPPFIASKFSTSQLLQEL
jgi:hypothetical protein